MIGSGKAYVFRDGRMIAGRWERAAEGDVTTFVTKTGETIPLAPGRRGSSCCPPRSTSDATHLALSIPGVSRGRPELRAVALR